MILQKKKANFDVKVYLAQCKFYLFKSILFKRT